MNNQSLQTRLAGWNEKVELVERALEVELQKDYLSRDRRLLVFLYYQKIICTTVISELCSLAEEVNSASNI
jgi:hypothetical protein